MSFKIKKKTRLENNRAKLELEISNEYFRKQIGKAYKDISMKARIPGFRKGKIPYQIIDANFGKPYVLQEAASLSISQLYPDIITDSGLKPVDYPKVKISQMEEEKPLGFDVEVELEPEISLPRYRGMKVSAIPAKVTDEEIETQLENIRKNFSTLEPLEDDRPAARGDYLTIDFEGKIDGKAFEGGSAQDYSLEAGSNTLFEGFEEALVGIKKGGKKQVSLVLPGDIGNQDLVGKKANFDIHVKEIKRRVLPELDEDFIKNLGEYKDVDEFKKSIAERLSKQKEEYRKSQVIDQVMTYIIDSLKEKIPAVMIDNRVNQVNEEMDRMLKNQKISRENYIKALNITEEQFSKKIRERAEKEVKEYLIIAALEKAEKDRIEPGEEEIEKERQSILSQYEKEEEKKKLNEYFKKPGSGEELKSVLRRRKLFDLLVESVKIVEEEEKADKIKKKKIWTPGDKTSGGGEEKPEKGDIQVP
ncbi:MAG: trigger factor [Actinobacteria bacterium]|nr:trigger factor [Actinomycetota bacterium]